MTDSTVSRRDFLKRAWQGATTLVATSMGYVGWRFLSSRTDDAQTGRIIIAGSPDAFLPGSVTPFPQGQFYLVRADNGGFLALSRQCTHLACMVLWQEETFRCPCHGSEFERTGHLINPPASHDLWHYKIAVENNRLVVDTGQRLERSANPSDDYIYIPEDQT